MSNVTAKIDYACQAVLALAVEHDQNRPLPMKAMAEAHKIPAQFLAQIFQQLRSAGLVISLRGASGGYRLARPPESITLWDVVSIFETHDAAQSSASPLTATIHAIWQDVDSARRQILESTTFADLAQQVADSGVVMYYI